MAATRPINPIANVISIIQFLFLAVRALLSRSCRGLSLALFLSPAIFTISTVARVILLCTRLVSSNSINSSIREWHPAKMAYVELPSSVVTSGETPLEWFLSLSSSDIFLIAAGTWSGRICALFSAKGDYNVLCAESSTIIIRINLCGNIEDMARVHTTRPTSLGGMLYFICTSFNRFARAWWNPNSNY